MRRRALVIAALTLLAASGLTLSTHFGEADVMPQAHEVSVGADKQTYRYGVPLDRRRNVSAPLVLLGQVSLTVFMLEGILSMVGAGGS